MSRKGRIENWQEIHLFGGIRMAGNVYECEAFEEGEEMVTSPIVSYHTKMGQLFIETQSGSWYKLGTPSKQDRTAEEIFSDARN